MHTVFRSSAKQCTKRGHRGIITGKVVHYNKCIFALLLAFMQLCSFYFSCDDLYIDKLSYSWEIPHVHAWQLACGGKSTCAFD